MKTSGNKWRVEIGDCRLKMQDLESESIDAVVVDPPYGISFMEKQFDKLGGPQQQQEFHRQWAVEAFRVLKPGGHILCFSHARTYHRTAAGIEDAGFEIRDQLMWIYGSGFPKSASPSRMIDKAAGVEPKVVSTGKRSTSRATKFEKGSGEWGHGFNEEYEITEPVTPQAVRFKGWGSNLKPAHEPIVLARKPFKGALHENMIEHGTGGLNIDGCRVGTEERESPQKDFTNMHGNRYASGVYLPTVGSKTVVGRWPANVIHDGSEEATKGFPPTADSQKAGFHGRAAGQAIYGGNALHESSTEHCGGFEYGDSGTAARYFYCAKASAAEREEFNSHPTVKPLMLMTYLIGLVAERGATILDPFCGSGSTGVAAVRAGYRFIGIDENPEYAEIACRRIGAPMQTTMMF